MVILNLGCGNKTSENPDVINIDWSAYLRFKKNPFLNFLAPFLLDKKRLAIFKLVPRNIQVHDLTKGLPFKDNSVNVVYHSHFLEQLERQAAKNLLLEIKRVLKLGGILRIVVPDFEVVCKKYISHLAACEINQEEIKNHDDFIHAIIEQFVRKEALGSRQQKPLRRFIENFLLGSARKRGQIYQWWYDRFSLMSILTNIGYKKVYIQKYNESLISNWNDYGLDLDVFGKQYKCDSLYVEAVK